VTWLANSATEEDTFAPRGDLQEEICETVLLSKCVPIEVQVEGQRAFRISLTQWHWHVNRDKLFELLTSHLQFAQWGLLLVNSTANTDWEDVDNGMLEQYITQVQVYLARRQIVTE
jgi:hypothetical protein